MDGHYINPSSPVNNTYIHEGGIYELGVKIVPMCATNDHVKCNKTTKENEENSIGEDACEGSISASLTKYLDL